MQTNDVVMKKMTKTQVLARLRKQGAWRGFLIPSNCFPRPGHPFNTACEMTFTREEIGAAFESRLAAFEYYNCNAELGRRVHFYEVVDDE